VIASGSLQMRGLRRAASTPEEEAVVRAGNELERHGNALLALSAVAGCLGLAAAVAGQFLRQDPELGARALKAARPLTAGLVSLTELAEGQDDVGPPEVLNGEALLALAGGGLDDAA